MPSLANGGGGLVEPDGVSVGWAAAEESGMVVSGIAEGVELPAKSGAGAVRSGLVSKDGVVSEAAGEKSEVAVGSGKGFSDVAC